MDSLQERIKLYKLKQESLKKERCERDEFINKFLDKLNPSREEYFKSINKKYKPLTESALVGIIKRRFGSSRGNLLKNFYLECERANNFTAFFWWKIKEGANKKLL
jgi:ribosomal protein S24E